MTTGTTTALRWRGIRRVYPIYVAIAAKFNVGPAPPFPDLTHVTYGSESTALEAAETWLAQMDEAVQPHQFRQVLQQTNMAASEEKLQALVQRHLDKRSKSPADRDKLSFLLTQYLWVAAPPSFRNREISVEEAAAVLDPVLGDVPLEVPEWLVPLSDAVAAMPQCANLAELQSQGFLDRGRQLKSIAGPRYFAPNCLLLFTHFNFCLRHTFVRVIAADAQAIEQGLDELESRRVFELEYAAAPGAPVRASIGDIRDRVQQLTRRVAGEYAGDDSIKTLQALREAVEEQLARTRSAFTPADERRIANLEQQVSLALEFLKQLRTELLAREAAPPADEEEFAAPPKPEAVEDDVLELAFEEPLAEEEVKPEVFEIDESPADVPEPPLTFAGRLQETVGRLRRSLAESKGSGNVLAVGRNTLVLQSGELYALNSNEAGAAQAVRTAIALRLLLMEASDSGAADPELFAATEEALRGLEGLVKHGGPNANIIANTAKQLSVVLRQVQQNARAARKS